MILLIVLMASCHDQHQSGEISELRAINKTQMLIGGVAFFVGALVYLIDRSPEQTYFVDHSWIGISLYDSLPNLFGFVGGSLPSLIHVFSFTLITVGLISCRKRGCLIVCFGWFLVDCAFELGQKFHVFSSRIVPDWLTGIPLLENTENFFLLGTFDSFDLAAITIGALAAYLVSVFTLERRKAK